MVRVYTAPNIATVTNVQIIERTVCHSIGNAMGLAVFATMRHSAVAIIINSARPQPAATVCIGLRSQAEIFDIHASNSAMMSSIDISGHRSYSEVTPVKENSRSR